MKFLLCPGSAINQRFKRWPKKKFLFLARKIINEGHVVSILIGPEEKKLVSYFSEFKLIISPPIYELREIGMSHDVIICNDSFLLHFFSFIDQLVIGIYGPTDPQRTLPKQALLVQTKKFLDCLPCWGSDLYGKCPISYDCLQSISVDEVFFKALDHPGKE